MKRTAYIVLSMGIAGLMLMLLVMTIGAQAPAHVGGNIIQVPDDYAAIQVAIDAAEEGDEIRVAAGTYSENIIITEGVTLSGGWDPTFSSRQLGSSTINGQGLGRVISITGAISDTVVTIDGFTIVNGDASGLGLPLLPELADTAEHTVVSGLPEEGEVHDLNPTEGMAELRAHLSDLAALGLYPGGERSLQVMLEQLAWRAAHAEEARILAKAMPAQDNADLEADPGAGGGIYSWNASLQLLNSTLEFNVANVGGEGYGGGVFAGQGDAITISGNVLGNNTAGMYGDGRGGGLYLTHVSNAVIEDNVFLENAASNGGGIFGVGGGLYVNESDGAVVQGNKVLRNTAHASWACSGLGGGGTGGGVQIRKSDGAIVKENVFRNNLSALHCGSHTGGLYIFDAADVQVLDNELIDNWGVLFQIYTDDYGGGLGLDTLDKAKVTGNMVRGNTTSLATEDHGWHVSYGGGIYGHLVSESEVAANTISANMASVMLTAFGGGMYLEAVNYVDATDNFFAGNMASLGDSGEGTGGGLDLRNAVGTLVQGNQFESNHASASGRGNAGALDIASWGPHSVDNTVDANLFLDNRASGSQAELSQGGAASIFSHGFSFSNNVVAGNEAGEGGGLFLGIAENGEITNNTLAGNSGAAILLAKQTTPVSFTNNIIVDHSVGISVTEDATATIGYTLWDGNDLNIAGSGHFTETHPVSGDPSFVDPAGHDYHLTTGSAAIDAGDPAGVPPAPDHDADGVTRPQWTAVDIGAYEWLGFRHYLPVIANSYTSRTGWAIGQNEGDPTRAAIVHTDNSGLSWELQGTWDLTANDISAVDDQTAWAALGRGKAGEGAILHTTDGGATWVSQTIPSGLADEIKSIKGLSRDEAWAVSLGGVVLHTTDGGATWNEVPHPGVQIVQVNRMDAVGEHVWIADSDPNGAIVHTADGGLTWRAEYLPNDDSPLTVHAHSPLVIWGTGTKRLAFYRTVNGGDEWAMAKEVGGLDHLDDVCSSSANDAWGVQNGDGVSGNIWRILMAADGTAEAKIFSPPELNLYTPEGVSCLETDEAWVVAQAGRIHEEGTPLGKIFHTLDGEQWIQQRAPTNINYWKVSFVGARR